jgi:hypothetical protein
MCVSSGEVWVTDRLPILYYEGPQPNFRVWSYGTMAPAKCTVHEALQHSEHRAVYALQK